MDPFPMRSSDESSRLAEALGGEPFAFAAFQAKDPRAALAQAPPELAVRELEFLNVAGEPFYLAAQDARNSRIIPVTGAPMAEFEPARLIGMVTKAIHPLVISDARVLTEYDAYYLDRHHELPLPVLRERLNDAAGSIFYIDPRTARFVGGYSSGMWVERWLYHGLHSINLPWLYNHRPAWDIVVLGSMLGGAALSITSVLIAWQWMRRKAGWRARG